MDRMLDLAAATLATFAPHVGTPFRLDHLEHQETFTLTMAAPLRAGGANAAREPFELQFDGARTDIQFDQQLLPLEHGAIGKLQLFLVPIARNANGTIRYQAVFN